MEIQEPSRRAKTIKVKMELRRAAAAAFLERQLHTVAVNARGQASPDPPVLEEQEPDRKRRAAESEEQHSEPDHEEIMAGDAVVTVPAALASLSAAQFRALLLAGWSKLPH